VSTSTTQVATERRPAEAFVPMLAMIVAMWVVEVIDVPLDGRLDRFGIRPRRADGLDGVLFSPFLHLGFGHLIANTVPFVVLGGLICLSGAAQFLTVTAIVAVIGGVGTWLTGGTNTLVVGASGLVFGYLLYLVTRGIFARNLLYLLGGVVVLAVYGSVLWGVLPRPGISWQGHLFGGVGGVGAASLLHGRHGSGAAEPPTTGRRLS
jgi:membrane associated rhomboid family serine protease